MGRRLLLATLIVSAATAWTSVAAAKPLTLRYCEKPTGPGTFVAATSNVVCRTAFSVVNRIPSRRCWGTSQCDLRPFVCISYWNGSFTQPFSFSRHGICTALGLRRIEFDFG